MFDIGFLELLFIGVVGLLVLGPERLPKAARTLGLWIGKIKRSVSGMQREISAQLEAEELRQKLNEQQQKLDESVRQVKRGVESIAEDDSPGDSARGTFRAGDGDAARQEAAPRESAPPEQRLDDALARARLDQGADEGPEPSVADKDASSR
ncbi:sec-independent protein translocase protein TatB [Halomonas campaniensis]|uniref:Sec-independent protein translocase protein TatB n=1 Tax=Halomonas campaniensis TaxID=213554 RepID=A0A7W5PAE9_9GAMM|nr:Sec-independent protein translocase protein TatB [Halomonas campaniensis]MBB3330635.1 sec-independent protein translocase protein TatB [Halomonas campaniensis]